LCEDVHVLGCQITNIQDCIFNESWQDDPEDKVPVNTYFMTTEKSTSANQLLEKLAILQKKQDSYAREIDLLHKEIIRLKYDEEREKSKDSSPAIERIAEETHPDNGPSIVLTGRKNASADTDGVPVKHIKNGRAASSSIEKFIGENLINKIGIAITIIGVAIGVKYSIDHDLISPLSRILLGYLFGAALFGLGIRLKAHYKNYSAVLVSGSMAIFYFITYATYTFYGLIPQSVAFALMVLITALTVAASLQYDHQLIALIGMVGAYAIPFLLSDDSGNAVILFSYIAIINIGILVVSFKKYWEPLYFASFFLTWLIFVPWCKTKYQADSDFEMAFGFLFIFFVQFYLAFLAYKVSKKREFELSDIILILGNSFIFYGMGYYLLVHQEDWEGSLGLFTLLNAVCHGLVCLAVFYRRLPDKNLLNFISGLALVFVTIAIPVQLEGNWITLLWAGEAALLFWIGRTKGVSVYETLSYPLMLLTFLSLVHDWSVGYFHPDKEQIAVNLYPIFNIFFLTSALVSTAFGFINWLHRSGKYSSFLPKEDDWYAFLSFTTHSILLISLYFAFRNEIAGYWDRLYIHTAAKVNTANPDVFTNFFNTDLHHFKTIWIINYSLLFFTVLSWLNIRKLKDGMLGLINLGINVLVIIAFLTAGLYFLGVLRDGYLTGSLAPHFHQTLLNIWIRYLSFAFFAGMLFTCNQYLRQEFLGKRLGREFDLVLHTSVLWVASSELINWMNIAGSAESYKLGLSILWGIYSLFLISLGVWKMKKHLRVGAIALFAVTLVKLFFYDLDSLDTISKTIVFVSLGVLLLLISFIYNKYRNIISD